MGNQYKKLEVFSSSHSRDILGELKFKIGHVMCHCSFQWRSVIHRVGLNMVTLSTKF